MDICIETIVRFFFLMIKYIFVHWGLSLTVIIIYSIIYKLASSFMTLFALAFDAFDLLTDMGVLGGGATAATGIGALAGASLGVLGSLGVGIFWAFIPFSSRSNIFLRFIGIPFFFLLGCVVGLLPIPTLGISAVTVWLTQSKYSDATIIVGIILALALPGILTPIIAIASALLLKLGIDLGLTDSFCGWLNAAIQNWAS